MSSIALSLFIGLRGKFELLEPFNTIIHPQYSYTVQSIQTLSDIINRGDDPRQVYDAQGVDESIYVADMQSNKAIIGLQNAAGVTYYVPESFISTVPTSSGVSYTPLVLTISLGMVPDEMELGNLEDVLKTAVLREIGVEAKTALVAVGSTEFIGDTEHARATLAREAAAGTSESQGAQLIRLERENQRLKTQIQELSEALFR